MNPKSRQLVERIRSSRAKPKLTGAHFAALADDVLAMGKQAFLEEIEKALAPAPKAARQRKEHPLEEYFQIAQGRTRFGSRREFVDAVVDKAVSERGDAFKLPARKRTMPALLLSYSLRMSPDELKGLLRVVSEQNAYARQA